MTTDTAEESTATPLPDDLGRHHLLVYLLVRELEPVRPSTLIQQSEYSKSLIYGDLSDLERRGYVTTKVHLGDQRKTLYCLDSSM
jgi:DNA-binding MarR family transcriptional regulator